MKIKDRDVVIPGQLLGEGINCGENCYREGNKIYSVVNGIARIGRGKVRIVPVNGGYVPKKDDLVIGIVKQIVESGWIVDINSPGFCKMNIENNMNRNTDLGEYFSIGDRISAKVYSVDEVNECRIVRPWKLKGGVIVRVTPKKIPRVVGKRKSMLELLKSKTNCNIVVGQNGLIWIKGEKFKNVELAITAIKKIEKEAQSSGLTDRISEMLERGLK